MGILKSSTGCRDLCFVIGLGWFIIRRLLTTPFERFVRTTIRSAECEKGRQGANNLIEFLVSPLKIYEEGCQLVTNCHQLKMRSPKDGKRYNTDVANTEQLLRIIQSIPSKKAEPFKVWLAQVGRERIEETIDPELTIDRALETYARLGYDADWINQRLQTIRARKELTDQWKEHGVEQGREYAILTDGLKKVLDEFSKKYCHTNK